MSVGDSENNYTRLIKENQELNKKYDLLEKDFLSLKATNVQLLEELNTKKKALENSVDKGVIEISSILGKTINHRIGNSIGLIRIILKDLLYGDYGKFDDEVIKEFKIMLASAEEAILARNEISDKVKELLFTKQTAVDFKEVKKLIEKNKDFRSNGIITIDIIGFNDLKPVMINLHLFMEVVEELMNNAIKSMPHGGKISIIGETHNNFNIIRFIDTGCGIQKQEMKNIFDKGYSKWLNHVSTGLGLFEIKNIMMFFGGKIEVVSEVKKGTTFILNLPIIESNDVTN